MLTLDSCMAQEEIVLEVPEQSPFAITLQDTENNIKGKKLKEKLSDIYYLEVEQIDKPVFLLKDILTKKFCLGQFTPMGSLWCTY